jgi:hypothetical protein
VFIQNKNHAAEFVFCRKIILLIEYMPLITVLPYLPSVEWFAEVIKQNEILFDYEMHYERQMHLNQMTILLANGKSKLSFPLKKYKNHTLIKDILISVENNWQIKHWQTIRSAYGRAAYFLYYADEFELLFQKKFIFLKDWNETMFELCLKILKSDLKFSAVEIFQKSYSVNYSDMRWQPKNKMPEQKTENYRQVFANEKFVQGLSIIDLIFNEGPDSIKYLL